MLSKTMEKALNGQINAELYSGYLYQAMHAWCLDQGLEGFANWMQVQALEEATHALRIYGHVAERGGRVVLAAIEKPQEAWDSALAMFEHVYEHEQKVTALINDLVTLAVEERDYATQNFLQWFVAEQVEEEASAGEVVGKLELAGGKGSGLFMIDRDLGARPFKIPADTKLQIIQGA